MSGRAWRRRPRTASRPGRVGTECCWPRGPRSSRSRPERWDAAELGILTAFWPDAFRALHPYEQNDPKEISWNWPRFPRSGYRLDHLFTTLEVERCEYIHAARTAKLSDHSALEADLA